MIRQIVLGITLLLVLFGCSKNQNSLLITVTSKYNLQETIAKFEKAMTEKGYVANGIINHTKRAKAENIYLRPTVAFELDNPKTFSALLTCNPSLAIDLPIRISVYSLLNGDIKLSYTHPEYWSLKHNIKDKNCISVVLSIARELNIATEAITK
ncbi:MAG: DUF302 domain-containing protein [Sulfurovum sp.]|nr:DUF302 domain-containing protein [Sulfurovum sp.]